MQIGSTPEQKKELEGWPNFGMLRKLIISSSPRHKRINLYFSGENEKKAMFQIDEKRARTLIQDLSSAVDDISPGEQ